MAQLGETKNYRLETHWLGVNKTEWANTLGENVSLLCPVSAHRWGSFELVLGRCKAVRRDLLLLLPYSTCTMDLLGIGRGRDVLMGRGLGPGCRVRRSHLKRFLWGISLCLQHKFCSRSNPDWHCQHWAWAKVINPAWCVSTKKLGGSGHCTALQMWSRASLLAHVK